MKKALTILLLLALAGGAGYWLWPISKGKEEKKKDAKPPVPVAVAQAVTRDLPRLLEAVGRTEAFETVTLKSRIDGQVAEVAFVEGQAVRAGDLLLRLDPADHAARLRQAEANLARDQAQHAKARADVERYATLRNEGFVSEEKVIDLRSIAAALEATLAADRAAVDLARLQLGYTTLRAPIAGVIGARLVHPGAGVKINDTELAVINRVRPLYVTFSVPEHHLPELRAAMAGGALKAEVALPGQAGSRFEGTVRFVDNTVDVTTGTVRLKAQLANEQAALLPGQFVNVRLATGVLRDAVTVPEEAVQQGPEGAFVFVLKDDGGAEPRPVRVVLIQDGLAAVAEGLRAGETVITDGHSRLTPGAKVKVKDDRPGGQK